MIFFFLDPKKKMGLEKYRILFERVTLKLKYKVESITEFLMYTNNFFFFFLIFFSSAYVRFSTSSASLYKATSLFEQDDYPLPPNEQ